MSQPLVDHRITDAFNQIDWYSLLETSQSQVQVRESSSKIEKNFEEAMNLIPESFIPISMLYVDVIIRGLHFKAFIDTGAQVSLLSKFMVQTCGLTHLVDSRYQGIAQGVGETKIIGRIHCLDVELGTQVIPCSFKVIESENIKLILGLDMLLSHGVTLDLRNKKMLIANEAIEFVSSDE